MEALLTEFSYHTTRDPAKKRPSRVRPSPAEFPIGNREVKTFRDQEFDGQVHDYCTLIRDGGSGTGTTTDAPGDGTRFSQYGPTGGCWHQNSLGFWAPGVDASLACL